MPSRVYLIDAWIIYVPLHYVYNYALACDIIQQLLNVQYFAATKHLKKWKIWML